MHILVLSCLTKRDIVHTSMNNKEKIQKYLTSKAGLIYSDKGHLYFSQVSPQHETNDFISFFDIFGTFKKKVFLDKREMILINNKATLPITHPLINSSIFEQDFLSIYKNIESNFIEKALWYNCYKVTFKKDQLFNLIFNAINSFDKHLFIFWEKDFLSITNSPEVLFEKSENDQYVSDCIAATAESPHLLNNDKFIREHKNVESNLLQKVQKISKHFEIEKREIIRYSNYYHYKSTIKFHSPLRLEELVPLLAPTSAIFGDPTERVRALSSSLNYYQKNPSPFYGGPILICQDDTTKALINIRNLTLNKEEGLITTGCGIVKGSTFEGELNESKLKMKSVMELVCG